MKSLFASIVALAAILAASSASAQTAPEFICKPSKTVAASFWGQWLSFPGPPAIVQYPNRLLNMGAAFDTIDFTAPCTGTYSFTVSFVRDADFHTRCTAQGTADDVYIQIWLHPADGGSDRLISSSKGAWAGQTPPQTGRATGADTIDALLSQNDMVYTKVLSDQAQPICLGVANFEGHKIGDIN